MASFSSSATTGDARKHAWTNFHSKAKITRLYFTGTENIGGNKFSASEVSPKSVKSKRRRKKEEEKKRLKVGNVQLRIANVTSGGAHTAAWAN